jgi:aldehyde:ferredoxin oxidoreductase
MGKILRVDLTNDTISEEELREDVARLCLGGRGLSAWLLFDELKPGIDPLGPDNKIVFATGAVTGIPFAGNCRYVVSAKSPLTNIWGEANASGFWGPELKFAGYDAIIVGGKSDHPVYLWIHNGEAEIRSAEHLWGRITGETEEAIRKELKDEKIRVACIGPGGESLVKYSCLVSDLNRANGRTGMGAVMGSKKLKAVAVRGTQRPQYSDEGKLMDLVRLANKEAWKGAYGDLLHKYGTDGDLDDLHATGRLPTKNFRKCTFDGNMKLTGETMATSILVKRGACYACPIACIRVVQAKEPYIVDPAYGGPEYETTAAFGSLCMNDDLVAVAKANELCNKYTIDTISTGVTIAFAMECYEKGLITKTDTEGIDLAWGNTGGILAMIEKIAKREGIGHILAEGVMRASTKIGRGSEKFALHIKGQEVPMHEPRGKKGLGLSYAISNRGACHLQAEHDDVWEAEEWLDPKIGFDKTISPRDRLDAGKSKALIVKIAGDLWALEDCLSICKFTAWPEGGIKVGRLAEIVNAATGWEFDESDLMTVGERAFNLCRAFNVREGISRRDDVLPERLMEPLTEGMYKGQAIPKEALDAMLDCYFELRGWDVETGVPLERKLKSLELDFAALELQRLQRLPA